MITLYKEKKDCYGCTACMSACPVRAITMEYDREGFLYPHIDASSCTGCGRCRQVCPAGDKSYKSSNKIFKEPAVYAFKHKDRDIRMRSSSGGAYTAISDAVIDRCGKSALYGVSFDPDFGVRHARASTRDERDAFRGSKYVQSDLKDTFCKVAGDLKIDLTVLFTGTPCQVAGLLNYLEGEHVDRSRLITNDLICFGVPSPLLWREYIQFIGRKSGISRYRFRHKGPGLNEAHNIHVEFKNKEVKDNTPEILIYERLFGAALTLRPSCYCCPFASTKRYSDITIGDFSTILQAHPGFDDKLGVSLVMINTENGDKLLDLAKKEVEVIQSTIAQCVQNRLISPTPKPALRFLFWEEYSRRGFIFVSKKYGGYGVKDRIKYAAKTVLNQMGVLRSPGRQQSLPIKGKL